MLQTTLWALGGTLTLILLYQHIRVSWPMSYFGPQETLAQYLSSGGLSYFLFRFVPPYLVFLLIGLYADDPNGSIVFTAIVYSILSTLLSVRSSRRGEDGSVRLTAQRISVLVSIIIGIAACAALSIWTAPMVGPAAPPLADIVANLIAAVVAAVLAVSYVLGTRYDAATRMTELSDDVVVQIRATALDNCVDQRLALAIAYVENVQRPRWFRRLERMTCRLNPGGSYGLFQVKGHGAVDDMSSCRIALGALRGTYPLLDSYGRGMAWSVALCAERHNPDARFAQMVVEVYDKISSHSVGATDVKGPDGHPLLEVSMIGRFGARIMMRGTFWSQTEAVAVEMFSSAGLLLDDLPVHVVPNGNGRASWTVELPIDARKLVVRTVSTLEECFTGEQVDVDLEWTHLVRDLTLRAGLPASPANATSVLE